MDFGQLQNATTSSTSESLLQIQFRPSRMHEQHSIDNMIIDVISFSKHILYCKRMKLLSEEFCTDSIHVANKKLLDFEEEQFRREKLNINTILGMI